MAHGDWLTRRGRAPAPDLPVAIEVRDAYNSGTPTNVVSAGDESYDLWRTDEAMRNRRRWGLSLRALMLAILVSAFALTDHRRRVAVDGLLAVVSTGTLLELGPSAPGKDPADAPDRGRYLARIHRVRRLGAEAMAGRELAEA